MNKVYREGDEIVITEEMLAAVEEKDRALLNARLSDSVSWRDKTFRERFPPGTKGICYANRINRTMGLLCIRWNGPNGQRETNVHLMEKAGLKFEHPEFEELSLMDCDEALLGPEELVEKGMRLAGMSEAEANDILEKVEAGMNRYDVVFYIP